MNYIAETQFTALLSLRILEKNVMGRGWKTENQKNVISEQQSPRAVVLWKMTQKIQDSWGKFY